MNNYQLRKIENNDIKYFTINLGLMPGYEKTNEYTIDDAIAHIEKWISERLNNNEPSFPFKITPTFFVYGFQDKEKAVINSESAIEIHGEIIREYCLDIFDDDVKLLEIITDFGKSLGTVLEQQRIHIQFNGEKYILE